MSKRVINIKNPLVVCSVNLFSFFLIISTFYRPSLLALTNSNSKLNSIPIQSQDFNEDDFFQTLNSEHLKIFSRTETLSYESQLHSLSQKGLTWLPKLPLLSEDDKKENPCSIARYKDDLLKSSLSNELIYKYWNECESKWRLNTFNPLTQAQQILRTDYEPALLPSVRMIQWTLENKIKLRGFLFLKGPVKRPLVIVRPGIFSHLKTSMAEKFILMQLFDEGPFHILFLPGNTSKDYIVDNHKFALGGEIEGEQTFEVVRQLSNTSEPLNQWINKINFVGISMGGHGLLKTHSLIQASPSMTDKNNLIGKTILLCPLVNLESTMKLQDKNPLFTFLLNLWFKLRLNALRTELGLSEDESLMEYKKRITTDYKESSPDWLSTKDFKNMLIIGTQLDPIIPPEYNFKPLLSKIDSESKSLFLPRGFHCSLPTSYQWSALSTTLNGFLESASHDPANDPTTNTFNLSIAHSIKQIKIIDIKLPIVTSRPSLISANQAHLNSNHFIVKLLLNFKNPLYSPQAVEIQVPTSWYDQSKVLYNSQNWNDTFKMSLLREFSSHITWKQVHQENAYSLQLYFKN